ncbi:hypothetical protein MLD38_036775 [Melastoma candidum]|uniref:Uncharacterized protein n=1 Tax=Melastoma candidum TaxID=119954 RepID=A0ACB9LKK6_9MYRT|nr:hypothetical protein MLD38_036775 [Melastoma candidum]
MMSNFVAALAMKWIITILVAAASVVMTIYMKRRIKGNQGASASHTSTGTPTSITSEYDVFLSFHGPDARHGIVDHLYLRMTEAGLRVFKDDEEIRSGEVIGGELERAIRCSRVYAIVFSRNYASSAWCLRCWDSTGRSGSSFRKVLSETHPGSM